MRMIVLAAGTLLAALPASAQTAGPTGTATQPPSSVVPGNGVTTNTNSGPEMKTGSERSPTAGAPTSSGTGIGGAANGGAGRN